MGTVCTLIWNYVFNNVNFKFNTRLIYVSSAKVQISNLTYNLQYMTLFRLLLLQYVHYLQRNYSLGSFNLLGHTAPAQAVSLLLVGPFLDCWLTGKRVYAYDYTLTSVVSFFSFLYYYFIIISQLVWWGILLWYKNMYSHTIYLPATHISCCQFKLLSMPLHACEHHYVIVLSCLCL